MRSCFAFVQFDTPVGWARIWVTTGSGLFRFWALCSTKFPEQHPSGVSARSMLIPGPSGSAARHNPRPADAGFRSRSAGTLEQAVTVRGIADVLRHKRPQVHPAPIQAGTRSEACSRESPSVGRLLLIGDDFKDGEAYAG